MNLSKSLGTWIDALLCTIFSFVVSGVLYLVFINLDAFDPFAKAFRDFEYTDLYYSKALDTSHLSNKIILVNVRRTGRAEIAETIERVMRQQPKVVGIDLRFEEQKDPTVDAALRDVLHKYPELITVYRIEGDKDSIIGYHPYFEQNRENAGFVNLNPTNDGAVVRTYLGEKKTTDHDTLYSLANKVATAYLAGTEIKRARAYKGLFNINYRSNLNNFITFDLDELREQDTIDIIKDKIVLIGYTGLSPENEFDSEDKHFTPFNPTLAGKSKPDMYGVVIHANVIDMMIHDEKGSFAENSWIRWSSILIAFLICIPVTRFGLLIHEKNPRFKGVIIKTFQLVLSTILFFIIMHLLKAGVWVSLTTILVLVLMSLSMIEIYLSLKPPVSQKRL